MDGAALVESVRTKREMELNRLGSEKALLAATEARLEADAVLVTAAATLRATQETLAGWASDADETGETLEDVAATLADAHQRVSAELEADGDPADVAAVDVPFLSLSATGEVERVAAATIAVPLVLDRLFLQSVSFFVNEADSGRADMFRELREMSEDILATGQETLDAVCTDDDWARAEEAAMTAIRAAYDDYVQRLDAMGFDPKPIC